MQLGSRATSDETVRLPRASILLGWMLIGIATTMYFGGVYSPTEITLVTAGAVLVGWAIVSRRSSVFGDAGPRVALVALRHAESLGRLVTIACVAVAILVCAGRMPRTAGGFLLGAAFTLGIFNVTYKFAFYNEWSLTAGLAVAAFAFWRAETDSASTLAEEAFVEPADGIYNPVVRVKSLRMALIDGRRAEG